jgi:hypothetical protein
MPSENHIKPDLVVKLEKAERWQEPPVLRRELLHHSSVTEIRLRHKHAEMVKMVKLRCLEVPADHKPHNDQHQRVAIRSWNRKTRS